MKNDDDTFFDELKEFIKKSSKKRVLFVEKEFIPWLDGRPKRDTIINNDDMLNLTIAFNTAQSIEEFLTLI